MTVTSPSDTPVALKKVTLRYSKVEDRIRMDALVAGELVAGENVITFWLTQRLCREMVKSLAAYFNEAGLSVSDASPQNQRAVQSYLHQTAQGAKKKAVPVPGKAATSMVLVDRVQLRTSRDLVQLILPLPDKTRAVLALRPNEARQWLDILYQQYQLAEWPLGFWPEWIRSAATNEASKGAPVRGRVH